MLTQAEPIARLTRKELRSVGIHRATVHVQPHTAPLGTLGSTGHEDLLTARSKPWYHIKLFPTEILRFTTRVYSDVIMDLMTQHTPIDECPTLVELYHCELLDTIRHEVAHAAHFEAVYQQVGAERVDYVMYGDNCDHGLHWKRWARLLGARPYAFRSPRHTKAAALKVRWDL